LIKISVIVPSFNQAQYLDQALYSLTSQAYDNLELIVIDGGSTDRSVEIIKRYAPQISYWVSEPDRGQTHAINKGLKHCTGDVWSYLNSDDLLTPGSLAIVDQHFQSDPTLQWLGGVSETFGENGTLGHVAPQSPAQKIDYLTPWHRENQYVVPCSNVSFMHLSILERVGNFDESYDYSMDIEYYTRVVFQAGIEPTLIPDILGRWRWHQQSKTFQKGLAYGFREDEVKIAKHYSSYLTPQEQVRLQQHIRDQERWLVSRRAIALKQVGQTQAALTELIKGVQHYPALLLFRPWYGAIRRCLV
jgi:glycosyltransferase involved in cell wall biosynthesis